VVDCQMDITGTEFLYGNSGAPTEIRMYIDGILATLLLVGLIMVVIRRV
jgi:hypothetical protein